MRSNNATNLSLSTKETVDSDPFFKRTTRVPLINGTNGSNATEKEYVLKVVLLFENVLAVLLNVFFILCILLNKRSQKLKTVKFLLNLQFTHVLMGVTSFVSVMFDNIDELVILFDALLLQMFLMLLFITCLLYTSPSPRDS